MGTAQHGREGGKMKRLVVALAVVLLAAGVVGGTASSSGGSTTFRTGCTLLDGDGGFVGTIGVVTLYASGKATLQCEAHGVANSSGGVVNWNYAKTGLTCFISGAGSTTQWRNRVGAEGQAQLYCELWVNNAALLRASADAGGLG